MHRVSRNDPAKSEKSCQSGIDQTMILRIDPKRLTGVSPARAGEINGPDTQHGRIRQRIVFVLHIHNPNS
jgi:hypothetical protein